jgi:hypothetical protein
MMFEGSKTRVISLLVAPNSAAKVDKSNAPSLNALKAVPVRL